MFRRILGRLANRGAPSDDEIARGLQDPLRLEADSLDRASPGAPSSRDTAHRRFGNVTNAQEAVRDVWRWAWLDDLGQDLQHGRRALLRSPAYSVGMIVTLAMGIGAGAAMYSLSHAIHSPFPALPQKQLLWITQTSPSCAPDCTELSPAAFAALRQRAPSLRPIAVSSWTGALRTADGSVLLRGFRLSPNSFEVIDAPFAVGRGFPNDAGDAGGPRLVVLSYGFWQRQFDGRRTVLDSLLTIDGTPYRVFGVLGKDVVFPMDAEVYFPYAPRASEASNHTSRAYAVFARLAPGASADAAAAETRTIGAQLLRESPATDSGWVLRARPIADFHTDDLAALEKIAGFGALLVFLAACMSAANLSLARLASRRHELALRTALGVRRWRLIRHVLTEAALLSVVACAVGALLARWAVRAIRDAIPPFFAAFLPGWARLDLDMGALFFALGAAVLAVIAFGVLPALRATRVDLKTVLSDGGRASTGGAHSSRTRATLIVLEVSTALVLLTAATLLARSVRNMVRGDAGVRIDHTLVMQMTLPRSMSDTAMIAFYRELDANLRATPGIRAAGVASSTPLSNNYAGTAFQIAGRVAPSGSRGFSAIDQRVTPGYADGSGFRIMSGRMIDAHDIVGAQRVIVINQMMANAFWPRASAIGRDVTIDGVPWSVIGVSSDVHHGGLDEPLHYTVYRSALQVPLSSGVVAVWTAGDPDAMRDVVRASIGRTDPSVAIGQVMTMEQMQARHVSAFAMMADMLTVLAAVTMAIAVVGLYGLISYGVAQRTRELGVRVALGARALDIVIHVASGAMRLTVLALVCGIVGAALFAHLLVSILYGVSPGDPVTYLSVSGGLLVVTLIAALLPSLRAARVDPMHALRAD